MRKSFSLLASERPEPHAARGFNILYKHLEAVLTIKRYGPRLHRFEVTGHPFGRRASEKRLEQSAANALALPCGVNSKR
jgi:hypothetical protein